MSDDLEVSSLQSDKVTFRDRLWGASDWLRGFLIMPRLLVEAPPGWPELTAYAQRGSWTSPRGFLRGLGTLWLLFIALPVVLLARAREWVLTRPSRALFTLLALELLLRTTSVGLWVGDLIRTLYAGLAWLLLP